MTQESKVEKSEAPTLGSPADVIRDQVAEIATVSVEGVEAQVAEVKTVPKEVYDGLQRTHQKTHDAFLASQANLSAVLSLKEQGAILGQKVDILLEALQTKSEFGETQFSEELKTRLNEVKTAEKTLTQSAQTKTQVDGLVSKLIERSKLEWEDPKLAQAKTLYFQGKYQECLTETQEVVTAHLTEVVDKAHKDLEEQKQKAFLKGDELKSEAGGGRASVNLSGMTPDQKIQYALRQLKK